MADLGLTDDVTFVGPQPRPELARLMRSARVVLVPSHSETFGLVALEAAASGTPVIAAAAGGLREAVAHGETGQLMDSRLPRGLGQGPDQAAHRAWPGRADGRGGPRPRAPVRVALGGAAAGRRLRGPAGAMNPDFTRAVFLHAHPDDETLVTGALLAALAASGREVAVVTATRGERGEIVPGTFAGSGPELVAHREAELASALAALGVARHAFLGAQPALAIGALARHYTDSGMRWVTATLAGPSADAGPDSLTAADPDAAAADLVAYLEHVGATVLVSYDAHGGYGHPDHVACHEIAVRAAERSGVPLFEIVSEPNPPDADATTFANPEQLDHVQRALRCHASQLTLDGAEMVHVGGQRQPVATSVWLRAARRHAG